MWTEKSRYCSTMRYFSLLNLVCPALKRQLECRLLSAVRSRLFTIFAARENLNNRPSDDVTRRHDRSHRNTALVETSTIYKGKSEQCCTHVGAFIGTEYKSIQWFNFILLRAKRYLCQWWDIFVSVSNICAFSVLKCVYRWNMKRSTHRGTYESSNCQ